MVQVQRLNAELEAARFEAEDHNTQMQARLLEATAEVKCTCLGGWQAGPCSINKYDDCGRPSVERTSPFCAAL